jgi:endothelin-converting enzyme/putative endopeptidase
MTIAFLLVQCSAAFATTDETTVEPFSPGDIDRSVDPCVDFYAYACNPWLTRHPIPPDRGSFGRGSQLALRNWRQLSDLLEAARADDGKRAPVARQVGDYYAACMDETASAKSARATLRALVARVDALPSLSQLPRLLADLHLIANSAIDLDAGAPGWPLFSFGSSQDYDDAKLVVTSFDQGGLGLPDRDYYLKSDKESVETQQKYRAHLTGLLKLYGESPARAKAEAELVYAIELALARGSMDLVARRDPRNLNHPYDDKKLRALSTKIDLPAYLQAIGAPAPHHHLVATPEFFRVLDAELGARPLAEIKTYLRVWLYNSFARFISGPLSDEHFAFYRKTLVGAREKMPRWKECTLAVDHDLGEALGQLYVAKYFPPNEKKAVVELVRAIEHAFAEEVAELSWMSTATRQQAMAKLHGMLDKIGYPDKWRDYSTVELVRDNWLGDALAASRFEVRRQLAKIGKPVDRLDWLQTAPTVDAYYDPQTNTMNFPAGILQRPFFDPALDDAVNLGEIGSVIGHELTHGFDDQGRLFDGAGNLRDWWTTVDGKGFEERAQCTVAQYGAYHTVGDLTINGRLTLGENTADNGGVRIAYRALLDRAGKTPDPKRDGLTRAQRFFVAYAQGWCRNQSDESLRIMTLTDPHSPPHYRVNGVLAVMPEFRAAYQCKAAAPMVAPKQCRIW